MPRARAHIFGARDGEVVERADVLRIGSGEPLKDIRRAPELSESLGGESQAMVGRAEGRIEGQRLFEEREGRVSFPGIAAANAATLDAHVARGGHARLSDLDDVDRADRWARRFAAEWLGGAGEGGA